MFLTIQLCQASAAVSASDQINNFVSSTLFANIIGLSNIATVFILFFYGLSLYKKQAIMTAEIQLDEEEKRKNQREANELLVKHLINPLRPLILQARLKITRMLQDELIEKYTEEYIIPFGTVYNKLKVFMDNHTNKNVSSIMYRDSKNVLNFVLNTYRSALDKIEPKDYEKIAELETWVHLNLLKMENEILRLEDKMTREEFFLEDYNARS